MANEAGDEQVDNDGAEGCALIPTTPKTEEQKLAMGFAPDLVLQVDLAVGMASPQLSLRPGLLPLPRIEYVRATYFNEAWCEVILKSGKMATVAMPLAVMQQKLQAYYAYQYAPHAVRDSI